jgi:hypothetical protein
VKPFVKIKIITNDDLDSAWKLFFRLLGQRKEPINLRRFLLIFIE